MLSFPPPLPQTTTALLRAAQENKAFLDTNLISSGWQESWELCVGEASSETFWTGIDCLDPINQPGVVQNM